MSQIMEQAAHSPTVHWAIVALAEFAEQSVGSYAKITSSVLDDYPDISMLAIEPKNPRARTIYIYTPGNLVVQVGECGGRWELDLEEDDIAFAQDLMAGVFAGQVMERTAPGRSRVEVTLPDGEVAVETGYEALVGLLPMPGWTRWGQATSNEPYSPQFR